MTFIEIGKERYRVQADNGVVMGHINRDCDLCFNFWPDLREGFWDESMMRPISDKLKELNEPIWREYEEFCKKDAERRAIADGACPHTEIEPGPRIPALHGSWPSETCVKCKAWRTTGHVIGKWRAPAELEEALQPRDGAAE